MSEIIDYVKSQPATKEEVTKALQAYKSADLATQAETGGRLIAQVKVYEEAVQIMGDNIYDLNVENDSLRNIIGNVDEKKVQELCQQKKLSDTKNDRNKIILASLQKTMLKSKAVCNNVTQK
jgi:hypothetical protein